MSSKTIKVGIVGASGYAGGELIRLLENHPNFNVTYCAANSSSGLSIALLHPHLPNWADRKFSEVDLEQMIACDLLFFALPHGASAEIISQLPTDLPIVDLGADFRLVNENQWEKYYGGKYAGSWSYGLVDLPGNLTELSKSKRIANPGCYATAITLSAAPLIAHDLIEASDITVVAASGTTGAGRTLKSNLLTSESANSLSPYKIGGVHQHTPEIEQALSQIAAPAETVKISFTPVLAPMPRGILATTTAKLRKSIDISALEKLFTDYYQESTDIYLCPEYLMPMTNAVLGSNKVAIKVAIDEHTNRVVVATALDNLTKGAAGQAIQNANLIMGLDITTGLTALGLGR